MARIKYFGDERIAIYIYGEKNERHHGKHVLVMKPDEKCNYDFNGMPVKDSPKLRNVHEHKLVSEWIRNHRSELEVAWEEINNGGRPDEISN